MESRATAPTQNLIVGLVWSSAQTEHLRQMQGADLVVSFLGSIVSRPVLLFPNVCMTRIVARDNSV
jgi:hypothetical protein